jgi:hypothetical protein
MWLELLVVLAAVVVVDRQVGLVIHLAHHPLRVIMAGLVRALLLKRGVVVVALVG